MPADTTRYSFPYQLDADAPDGPALGQDLAEAIEASLGSVEDRVAITEVFKKSWSSISATGASPLTTNNADTLITTVTPDFKSGYAYEVFWQFHVQMQGGSGPFVAQPKIRRTNASGTEIRGVTCVACITTNVMECNGRIVLKCTGGNTTQTIALTCAMGGSGSPTSMNLSANSTRKTIFVIRPIGLASDYPDATEVPTS